jgi:hypothetical protein
MEEPQKNPIENALGLSPLPKVLTEIKNDMNDNSTITDFSTARANIKNILAVGSNAISELGNLATQSQDPEAYAALSKLIKDVSDASVKLISLHSNLEEINNKKYIKENRIGDNEETSINLFFSTKEIFKVIKEIDGEALK